MAFCARNVLPRCAETETLYRPEAELRKKAKAAKLAFWSVRANSVRRLNGPDQARSPFFVVYAFAVTE